MVPEQTPTKKIKATVTDEKGKKTKQYIDEPQPVKAFVTFSPFGDGEWLTFEIGAIPKKGMNYAFVEYKGSYVRRARLITRDEIPRMIRDNLGTSHIPYRKDFDQKSTNPFD